jgi:hypothetical protein
MTKWNIDSLGDIHDELLAMKNRPEEVDVRDLVEKLAFVLEEIDGWVEYLIDGELKDIRVDAKHNLRSHRHLENGTVVTPV